MENLFILRRFDGRGKLFQANKSENRKNKIIKIFQQIKLKGHFLPIIRFFLFNFYKRYLQMIFVKDIFKER